MTELPAPMRVDSTRYELFIRLVELVMTAMIVAPTGFVLHRAGFSWASVIGGMLLCATLVTLLCELARKRPLEISADGAETREIPSFAWNRACNAGIVCVTLGTFALSEFYSPIAASTFAVAGLLTFVMLRTRRYGAKRSLLDHALAVSKPFFLTSVVALLPYVMIAGFRLADDVPKHAEARALVDLWKAQFFRCAIGTCVGLVFLISYIAWLTFTLSFSRARLSAIKDIEIRLGSTSGVFGAQTGGSVATSNGESITRLLNGIRELARLSSRDSLLRKVSFGKPVVTSVWYFVPDGGDHFMVKNAAWPARACGTVLQSFERIRAEYRPKRLNEPAFRELVEQAKVEGGRNWKAHYLLNEARYEVISACGWVYAKQEVLRSYDAQRCFAFNDAYFNWSEIQDCAPDDLAWLRPGSFMACPVPGVQQEPTGVVVVLKNVRNGFASEDVETLTFGCQLLGQLERGLFPPERAVPVASGSAFASTLQLTQQLEDGDITPAEYARATARRVLDVGDAEPFETTCDPCTESMVAVCK